MIYFTIAHTCFINFIVQSKFNNNFLSVFKLENFYDTYYDITKVLIAVGIGKAGYDRYKVYS